MGILLLLPAKGTTSVRAVLVSNRSAWGSREKRILRCVSQTGDRQEGYIPLAFGTDPSTYNITLKDQSYDTRMTHQDTLDQHIKPGTLHLLIGKGQYKLYDLLRAKKQPVKLKSHQPHIFRISVSPPPIGSNSRLPQNVVQALLAL
jgi:hypothetical protein